MLLVKLNTTNLIRLVIVLGGVGHANNFLEQRIIFAQTNDKRQIYSLIMTSLNSKNINFVSLQTAAQTRIPLQGNQNG